ncbi:alanine racemase [Ruegeria pomeroyi]|uniref:alanine racemase n=1 Tax=Ruegeria alba TaxID=2916756 RepID=A0ABS9NT20_9RHOB|nr:alanine racemase [Ruegeria alba]MCE8511996.1 alanine racemase [Ruegeria pomeroyi]MCE8520564.1 alanine racemase [Ruegeria pomeroyi]MCE8524885.1 alanine racemase [Ruegeria pomeroyi]MCE8528578.1 alanine racemase [Ruegeria pomeroyi]MCE8533002.1 alanine racemase [Ruegeria pomeroyi]
MPASYPASWCTIHRDRISRNLELALGLVPNGRRFCAVLKADAYGHGIMQVVPLVQEQGVTTIGITSNAEADAVRKAGFKGTIIRLRAATPLEIETALENHVEEQVASLSTAEQIAALTASGRFTSRLHLSLNAAGMARDGLEISTTKGQDTCRQIIDTAGSRIGGICSHFSSNAPGDLRQSSELFQQQAAWVLANSDLKREQILVHAGSSLTLVSGVDIDTDMYRCGAILYGILKPELGFRPTMDVEARVVSLQTYPGGASVGYDRSSHLDRDRRLACISIGYENGYRRLVQGGGVVAVRDALAPVLGKVSMNAIVADVTDLDQVEVGDTVRVFGESKTATIRPSMVERQFETIMADLYTDWGQRNARVYR